MQVPDRSARVPPGPLVDEGVFVGIRPLDDVGDDGEVEARDAAQPRDSIIVGLPVLDGLSALPEREGPIIDRKAPHGRDGEPKLFGMAKPHEGVAAGDGANGRGGRCDGKAVRGDHGRYRWPNQARQSIGMLSWTILTK